MRTGEFMSSKRRILRITAALFPSLRWGWADFCCIVSVLITVVVTSLWLWHHFTKNKALVLVWINFIFPSHYFQLSCSARPICSSKIRSDCGISTSTECTGLSCWTSERAGRLALLLSLPLSVEKIGDSIPWSVKSDTVSPTARHRCDVSSELCCLGSEPRRWNPPLVTRFGVMSRV